MEPETYRIALGEFSADQSELEQAENGEEQP
jgi:hypothetical protein